MAQPKRVTASTPSLRRWAASDRWDIVAGYACGLIAPLADLPAGVIGFTSSRAVSREEYVEVLLPARSGKT